MKVLGLILLVTLELSSASKPFKIRGDPHICADATEDHYLVPDPEDCHKFYSCVADGEEFIAYHFTCPAKLAFDPNLKRCEHEEDVDSCKPAPTTTTTTTEPTTTTTTEQTTTTTEAETEATTEPEPETTTTEPEPEPTTEPEPETTTTEPEADTTTTEAPLPNTEVICENRVGQLTCEDGKVIHVASAFYGRHDDETCPHSQIQTTSCHSDRLEFVQSICDGHHSCSVAANNGFGDPCKGTYKYIHTTYFCV